MKLLSLFSGIGAFEKALDRIGINYELVNYCEIDKYASKAYAMMHDCDESLNLGDIKKIDTSLLPNDIDLITYGFPCQDISNAGKLKGFEEKGERTRSGLFFEALRIIEDTKPRIAIAENVKNLTSKKFQKEFDIVLTSLEQAGYNNYYQVLNAKDYGIPQNRERVFIISIRKDIDNGLFEFPKPFVLKSRLKDVLEDEVDEKYYISEKMINYISANNEKWTGNNNKSLVNKDIASTLNTGEGSRRCDASNYIFSDIKEENVDLKAIRKYGILDDEKENIPNYLKIRKLTPLECFRLMGFLDEDFYKIKGISNTQLYKMAGNSIVVNVLVHLFESLFKALELTNALK